ncbi:MAG: hypoxanthine phosphoribosyltransferase [Pseudomonadota bacterium]
MPIVRNKAIDVLFSASTIARRNLELAREIADHEFNDLLVVSVLKGSFIFAGDLVRAMHDVGLEPQVEFMMLSTYGKGTTPGEVNLVRDVDSDVVGRDVLLVDDILESGRTMTFARDLFLDRGAKNVSIAVLLDKRVKRDARTPLGADFVGFECPDHFVVGYGMDVAHAFRELPFVGVVTGDA